MKKWKKPEVVTIDENDLKELIINGACSIYCMVAWGKSVEN